jgi:hypothetical protein
MVRRRRDLVEAQPTPNNSAAPVMLDHFHALLQAESAWLERALSSGRIGADSRGQS